MNFIDRIKISRNPNIIDTMNEDVLNDEIVNFAINKGYKFNKENIVKLIKFETYYNKFKFRPEIVRVVKKVAKEQKNLGAIFKYCEYNKDRFASIISGDDELIKIIINKQPNEFIKFPEVLKVILNDNTELFDNNNIKISIKEIISSMDDDTTIKFLKEIKYPFDSKHVIDRLPIIIECIKNDYCSHPNIRHQYSKEDFFKIYKETNEYLEPEMVLDNIFLIENPFFVKSLIMQGVEIDLDQLLDTRYYEEMYLELKAEAIKNHIYIPRPPKYDDVIQFEGNIVYVEADNLENVLRGLKYIRDYNLEQDLTIMLRQGKYDEFLVTDNYDFFKELQEKGINVDFTYNSGENIYSLDKVLRDEELLQNIVEDIEEKNLSPLERLIAVYDIVKVFKPYKDLNENQNGDTSKSRALYEYLNNNYMVCAGYADFFTNLCRRLGIKCADIGLVLVDLDNKKMTGHSRNYVNITDEKYDIDGLYVVDTTWENNGKPKVSSYEEIKSTYKHFLLTTDEGRKNAALGSEISVDPNDGLEGYDIWMTAQSVEELQEYFQEAGNFRREKTIDFIKNIVPEVYQQISGMELEDFESCNILLNYFKEKINKAYPKEKLLEAVLNVKKKVYENITETELEDMKIGYSLTSPFLKSGTKKWSTPESKAKYKEFIRRRLKKKEDSDENSR